MKVIIDPRDEVGCEIRETLKRVGRVRGRGRETEEEEEDEEDEGGGEWDYDGGNEK